MVMVVAVGILWLLLLLELCFALHRVGPCEAPDPSQPAPSSPNILRHVNVNRVEVRQLEKRPAAVDVDTIGIHVRRRLWRVGR